VLGWCETIGSRGLTPAVFPAIPCTLPVKDSVGFAVNVENCEIAPFTYLTRSMSAFS
jgi:hypothetical protein